MIDYERKSKRRAVPGLGIGLFTLLASKEWAGEVRRIGCGLD
jgi:hypothetical protein